LVWLEFQGFAGSIPRLGSSALLQFLVSAIYPGGYIDNIKVGDKADPEV
jgi:hypothetical protein